MANVLKIVGVLVVLAIGGKLSQKLASNQIEASEHEAMTGAISAINAQLPKDLGSGVTFIKAEVLGKTVRNTYAIAPGAPFDPNNRDALEGTAVTQVCSVMAPMAEAGFTIDFRYEYTAFGIPKTLDISVPPNKCA